MNTSVQIIIYKIKNCVSAVAQPLSNNAVNFEKNNSTSNVLQKARIEIQTGIKYSATYSTTKTKLALYEKSLNR